MKTLQNTELNIVEVITKILDNEMSEKEKFAEISKELGKNMNLNVEVDIINKRTRNNFFNKHKNIYNQFDVSNINNIHVDKKTWFYKAYGLKAFDDVQLNQLEEFWEDDIFDLIETFDTENYFADYEFELLNMELSEIKERYPEFYDTLMSIIEADIEDMDFYDLVFWDILREIYGIHYPDEVFNEFEILAYWTIYYEPDIFDENIAWEVGLFPFEYDGLALLALGGCGMDLSPKLDAYQALTDGSIPARSEFLKNPNYAKYVVGEETFNKVMKAITMEEPLVKINVY